MKCSKCGEECRDNQAFCLKCGNPIQVVPDFNLIEAELANNIGELLDEEKDKKETDSAPAGYVDISGMETKKIDKDLAVDLKLMNLSRHNIKADNTEKIVFSQNKVENQDKVVEAVREEKEDVQPEDPKKKKKRIIIMSSVIAAVVLAIVIAAIVLINVLSKKNDYNKATFESSYNKAQEYVREGAYSKAEEHIKIAINKATNAEEKITARLYLDSIYINMSGKDEDKINNLIELTKLCPDEVKYFESVAKYYMDKKEYTKLSEFVNAIENEDVYKELSDYTVNKPVCEKESGKYSSYMKILFTADDGCKIYYTIHRVASLDDSTKYSEPSVDDQLLVDEISLDDEGIYVIQAIAIDSNGLKSRVSEYRYEISLEAPSAPELTPTTGAYNIHTEITMKAPEGTKIYYSIDNEEVNASSQVYTEPIDMPVGIHVIRAVAIDANGLISDISEETYNLTLSQNYNTTEAKEGVIAKLIEDGVVMGNDLITSDGGRATVSYKEKKNVENSGYYIFSVTLLNSDGLNIGELYYGYDYNAGGAVKIDIVEGEYKIVTA